MKVAAEKIRQEKLESKVDREAAELKEMLSVGGGAVPTKAKDVEATFTLQQKRVRAAAGEIETAEMAGTVKLKSREVARKSPKAEAISEVREKAHKTAPRVTVDDNEDRLARLRRPKAATEEPEDFVGEFSIDSSSKELTESVMTTGSAATAASSFKKSLSPEMITAKEKSISPEGSIKEVIARAKKSKTPSSKEPTPETHEGSPFAMKLRKSAPRKKEEKGEEGLKFRLKKTGVFKRALQKVSVLLRYDLCHHAPIHKVYTVIK